MAEKKIEPERCRLWVYDLTADAFDEQVRISLITRSLSSLEASSLAKRVLLNGRFGLITSP